MSQEEELENVKRDRAARIIQKAWTKFLNVAVFQHFKSLINFRRQGEPRQIVKYINPIEAELLDPAAGIQVRFRLGGAKFPPGIYYKIFTHRHIEDLCANSPRDYTKLPSKYTSHIKGDHLREEDHKGWYHRTENNGWRLVSDTVGMGGWKIIHNSAGTKSIIQASNDHVCIFHKIKQRKLCVEAAFISSPPDISDLYYKGTLRASTTNDTNDTTLNLINTATKGLIRAIEDGGLDSVMEWEVDEVLNWTNTLNFDEYIANWKEIATSKSSANFKAFCFHQVREIINEDLSQAGLGPPDDTKYKNTDVKLRSHIQTAASTYGV